MDWEELRKKYERRSASAQKKTLLTEDNIVAVLVAIIAILSLYLVYDYFF